MQNRFSISLWKDQQTQQSIQKIQMQNRIEQIVNKDQAKNISEIAKLSKRRLANQMSKIYKHQSVNEIIMKNQARFFLNRNRDDHSHKHNVYSKKETQNKQNILKRKNKYLNSLTKIKITNLQKESTHLLVVKQKQKFALKGKTYQIFSCGKDMEIQQLTQNKIFNSQFQRNQCFDQKFFKKQFGNQQKHQRLLQKQLTQKKLTSYSMTYSPKHKYNSLKSIRPNQKIFEKLYYDQCTSPYTVFPQD